MPETQLSPTTFFTPTQSPHDRPREDAGACWSHLLEPQAPASTAASANEAVATAWGTCPINALSLRREDDEEYILPAGPCFGFVLGGWRLALGW